MQNQDDKVEDLLNQALTFQPGERAAFLAGACGSNQDLRSKVETLLKAHAEADGFLPETTTVVPVSEQPGTRIDRYKLLQKIGEGGMGVVYMAEQDEPVRRRVALKIIKLGMDTRSVVARFEAERQALALMDHPNIARVLDGGATETGRPYFVMELVQGVPITEFCDKNRLNAQARIKLFIQVCQAIQSAHQKGIIHRDIKPSNVLVTLHHGEPMPKVIDFGIAKATNQKLTEKTLFTQHATMIGTPAYMSPEQAEMSSMDVDTRADIYSLGVLLYELLTGSTPFPQVRLLSLAYGEMQRVIMEEEPERPSTRLGTLEKEQKTAVARNHGQELASLCNLLRGDLDWVVMKCLEKDRTRRYETANGLASDLKRHLENEPVIARPPSHLYRFQKAIRRNRLVFAAAGAVAAVLLLGIGASTWMFLRERAASRRAMAAEQEQASARLAAEEAQGHEAAERRAAVEARDRAEARAYAGDINLAQRALAKHNFAGARQLLERHFPQAGQTNRPGWEWRYLWGQAQSDALFKVAQKEGMIESLALSHDGKQLAVTLMSGSFSVLDISDLRAPREITQLSTGPFGLVSASPRGPLLVYSSMKIQRDTSWQSTITLWDLDKRQAVATAAAGNSLCTSLAFFPDGKSVAVLMLNPAENRSENGRLEIWRVEGFQRIASYELPVTTFYVGPRIVVAPDQTAIAVAGDELRVIDLTMGAVRWSAKADAGAPFNSVALSPDAKTLFSSETTKVPLIRVWNFSSGKETGPRLADHTAQVNRLIVSPDGKTLASASRDQTIRLWDVTEPAKTTALGRPLQGSKAGVISMICLPDGKTVISASYDGSIYAWDITAVRSKSSPVTFPNVEWFEFDSAGTALYTLDQTGELSRRGGKDFQNMESLFNIGKDRKYLCLSPDSQRLAVGSTNGVFELWNIPQKKSLGPFGAYPKWVIPHSFSPDNMRLIVKDEANRLYCEWDLSTMAQTRTYGPLAPGLRALFTDDWRLFLSCSYMGKFSAEDVSSGRQVTRDLDIQNVTSIQSSRDGKRFAVTSSLGCTGVWETETLRPVAMVGDRSDSMYSASFSPDGTRLITGGLASEQSLVLWDLATQLELMALKSTASHHFYGQFSPDGNVLAAQTSVSLELWRAPSWEEIEQTETEARRSAAR